MDRPTIEDIARAAGVSKATASRALRGAKGQSEATRKRIVRIADRMGYTPHPLISALMTDLRLRRPTSYSPVVALVHRLPRAGFRARNLTVLKDRLHAHLEHRGYRVENFYVDNEGFSPKRLQEILRARGIRAVVFEQIFSALAYEGLDLGEFASVIVGSTPRHKELHNVAVDQFSNVLIAAEEVLSRGYHRVGLVVPQAVEEVIRFKREAALFITQKQLDARDRIEMFPAGMNFRGQQAEFSRWLKKHRPDVILSNVVSLPAMLERLNLRVPQDLGFVHLGWHAEDEGRFAGVDPHWGNAAITAGDVVVDQLNRNQFGALPFPLLTLISGTWVDGPSVRKRPQKRPVARRKKAPAKTTT